MKYLPLSFAMILVAATACSVHSHLPDQQQPTVVEHPSETADLQYQVQLVPGTSPEVVVSLGFRGSETGRTTIALDEGWGGVEHAASFLHDLEVRDGSGHALATDHPSEHEWVIPHAPSEEVVVKYRIASNTWQDERDEYYRPLLNANLFHMIGLIGLIRPTHLDDAKVRNIGYAWVDFEKSGWKVASSFSTEKSFQVHARLDQFRQAVFLAGDLRVEQRSVRGRPLFVAIAGHDFGFEDAELVDRTARIVEAERVFFDDFEHPYYLVSAIPIGRAEPGHSSLGGTGLTQSFALFLLRGTRIEKDPDSELRIEHTLAHEMFHEWNGRIVERVEPEQFVYWFSEGFTDFFARRLLRRAGFLDLEQYVEALDRRIAEYMLSPVRNAPNERIGGEFWKNRSIEQLPYFRGDVVAMILDHEILSRTGGRQSLDDFMRETVALGRAGERIDTSVLLARVQRWTDASFAERLRRIVEEGATAELDPESFAPCLAMRTDSIGRFEPGFDVDATRTSGIVSGVVDKGSAFAAGLRDGQSLRGLSIRNGDPMRAIEATVLDAGIERKLRWLPQGPPIPVPRFVVASGADPSDCSRL